VRILKVPPAEMFPMLKLGYIDGFCCSEPWTSLVVQAGAGVCAATSATLAPLHPEKVLAVREEFSRRRADEHHRLIAALLEACAFCDQPENRPEVCELLAKRQYLDVPLECIQAGLMGSATPDNSPLNSLHGLNIFHRHRANDPTPARAAWLTGHLHRYFRWRKRPVWLDHVFRRDLFAAGQKLFRAGAQQSGNENALSQSCEFF
jgi:ABC-type nitrate/sulfonate/bicarbonate transport system substrate-binding protein